jgi:SAM-dependent methyltransferase
MADVKATFSGSIPEYYDRYLGPAWFDAYAQDLAQRLPAEPPGDVLEIACGTGLVTRHLRERLDSSIGLVATDLSTAMLDYARAKLRERADIEWRQADAAALPFADGQFGALVCAFGMMFVPDKQAAFREAFRVLKEGGLLLFNVWDRVAENPHVAINAQVMEGLFPGDEQMRFTVPYDMHDPDLLRQLVGGAGFREVRMHKRRLPVDRVSARSVAVGQVRGTPRFLLVEQRGIAIDDVIDKVTAALAQAGGADPYRGVAQAIVVEARR